MASCPTAAADVPADFVGVQQTHYDTFDAKRRTSALVLEQQANVGIVRLPFDWKRIETAPGSYDFSTYDAVVRDAARHGLELLPTLIAPPEFRSTGPVNDETPEMYPPRDPADMAALATALVGRYGPGGSFWAEHRSVPFVPIRSWQVWNEPSIPAFWMPRPDAAAYVRLLDAVGSAIRAADPAAEVVAAGLPNSSRGVRVAQYLTAMYAAGARGMFDTLAIHPYADLVGGLFAQVEEMRTVAAGHGDAAPIWVTEFGWATGGQGRGPGGSEVVTEAEQARLVRGALREFDMRRESLGLRGFSYFYWRENPRAGGEVSTTWAHVGLIGPGGGKPALYAFAEEVAAMRALPLRLTPPAAGEPEHGAHTPDPAAGGGGTAGADGYSGRDGDDSRADAGASEVAASLSHLRLARRALVAAPAGAIARRESKCARGADTNRGSCFTFRLTRAAAVSVRIVTAVTAADRAVGAPLRIRATAGRNRLWLSGRSSRGALAAGAYRLVIRPLDANGRATGPAVTRPFEVRARTVRVGRR